MADDFDLSEVHKLSVDLGKGNAATVMGARKILEVAATKIKKGMASDAKGIRHAPAFPASITYDIKGLSAEIGPDKAKRAGALGNLLYFGSSHNGPRISSLDGPLKAEAPIFSGLLSELAEKYLL